MQLLEYHRLLHHSFGFIFLFELSLQRLFFVESGLIVLMTVSLKVVSFSRPAWFDDRIIASSWNNVICLVHMTLNRHLNCRAEYMYLYMFHYFGEFSWSESPFLPGGVDVQAAANVVVRRVSEHALDHFLIYFSMIIETRRRRSCIRH